MSQGSLFDEAQSETSRRRDVTSRRREVPKTSMPPTFSRVEDYRRQMISAVRDAGTQRAIAAEDPEWLEHAHEVIERFAASGEEFSADDVRAITGDPVRPGSMGAAFRAGVRQGLIQPAGLSTSRRIARHGGLLRLWVGTQPFERMEVAQR